MTESSDAASSKKEDSVLPDLIGSPNNTSQKKSVSSILIKSFRSHLKVLSSSQKHYTRHGSDPTPTIKEGDLYYWNGGDSINTENGGGSSSQQQKNSQQKIMEAQNRDENTATPMAATAAADTTYTKRSTPTPLNIQTPISSTYQKQRKFYMPGPFSPGLRENGAVPLKNTWSWSEQFFSQDDMSVSISHDSDKALNKSFTFPAAGGDTPTKFKPILEGSSGRETDDDDDNETCNNTVVEKVRQRSKKATNASNVAAFVTFLKALFGIGMLSNPAVLGEVGLLLGTFCHLFIVVGCAFACYLLLAARQMAKVEVMAKQQRGDERRKEYEMWKLDTEKRAAKEAAKKRTSSSQQNHDSSTSSSSTFIPNLGSADSNIGPLPGVDTLGSNTTADWTVAPVSFAAIPLERVTTSIIPPAPKQGWGRCEDAIQNISVCNYNDDNATSNTPSRFASTASCGNVQMIRQQSKKNSRGSLGKKKSSKEISDEYQRFSENIHQNYMIQPPGIPQPIPPPPKEAPVRLVTYGDVAKYLAGKRASFFIIFIIVAVHLMFASGMIHLAVENLCYVVGWERLGWSYVEYIEEDERYRHRRLSSNDGSQSGDRASRSSDEEEYYLEWNGPDFIGRLAMASLLFPIIQGLLQIPSLRELAMVSTVGLVTYAFGCVGSMLYTALVLTDGHPFGDQPDNMWKSKWSGVPTYVATTIYCIEGINLALPTVSSIEGTQRWGGGLTQTNKNDGGTSKEQPQDSSVYIVVGAVFLYGMVTLVVSWIGLAGGLGGGTGTMHGEDGCWDVTYCLNSSSVRFVYMLSLGVALVLTVPVILYPSTEMLEVWLDERTDERLRKMEADASMKSTSFQHPGGPQPVELRQKSIMPDDDEETLCTVHDDIQSPHPLGIVNQNIASSTKSGYVAPTWGPDQAPVSPISSPTSSSPPPRESSKLKAKRKLKYWKLRMLLAFIICIVGTLEGSFPAVLKAAEVIRGVGLSIAGLIFPPLLYMSASGGNFSVPMAAAMALLIGLGFFNIVLVLMSAFGSRDFIIEEGRGNLGNFYDMR